MNAAGVFLRLCHDFLKHKEASVTTSVPALVRRSSSSHPSGARPLRWRSMWRSSPCPPWIRAPRCAHPVLWDAAPEARVAPETHTVIPAYTHAVFEPQQCSQPAPPLPERGYAGRCSAPATHRLRGDSAETSAPSGTEGGCWRSHDSSGSNLREEQRSVSCLMGTHWLDVPEECAGCAAPTVGLLGGSRVRGGRCVDQRVGGQVGELRDRPQQTAGVCQMKAQVRCMGSPSTR